MSEPPDLSIVIVSWNVRDFLKQCVKSIYQNTKRTSFEIIVVDNASSDGSIEMVQREFPHVITLINPDNRGFNVANNQGIKIAKGRNILLLNPDTIVLDNALIEEMVRTLDSHVEIAAVGPKLLCADMKTVQLAGARTETTLWTVLTDRFVERKVYNSKFLRERYYHSQRYVATLSGACMMFKKSIVKQAGFMDERFFMYLDDVDYCKRIRDAGWKVLYLGHLPIVHFGGESSSRNIELVRIEFHRSLKRYFSKHFGSSSVILLKLIMVGKLAAIIVSGAVRTMFRKKGERASREMSQSWQILKSVYIGDA